MTNTTPYEPAVFRGNGVTKNFPFEFTIYAPESIEVFIEDNGIQTKLEIAKDYAVDYTDTCGTVTTSVAPTIEQFIIIGMNEPLVQEITFSTSTGFSAKTIETCFDKIVSMIKQLAYDGKRAIRVPMGSENLNLSLPKPEEGKTLKWNSDGTGLINSTAKIDEIGEAVELAITSSDGAIKAAQNAQSIVDKANSTIDNKLVTFSDMLKQSTEAADKAEFYAQNAERPLLPFCINDGRINEAGEAEILTMEGDLLTLNAPFTYTLANGKSYRQVENLTFDCSTLDNGLYNVLFFHDDKNVMVLKNRIYRQKSFPVLPAMNDIWYNGVTSYIYKTEAWEAVNVVSPGLVFINKDEIPGENIETPTA